MPRVEPPTSSPASQRGSFSYEVAYAIRALPEEKPRLPKKTGPEADSSAEAAGAANFTVLVRNHMRADEEIARFCAEHGVTDNDLLIAQVLVPFETRPGETAKGAMSCRSS